MHSRREWPAVAIVTLLAISIFFRAQIANRFTLQFSDPYDGMIEISLMQHWANVLAGSETWTATNYFHPYPGTIGYNDGYLLYGVVFGVIRAFGADPLLAAELVHVAARAVGVGAMYALLRGPGGCRIGWSLLGALVFATANNSFVQALHGQLLMVSFVPLAAVLLWQFVDALIAEDRRVTVRRGIGLALVYALWISTAYYMAWYFGFFLLVMLAVALVSIGTVRRRAFLALILRQRGPLALVLLAQIVLLVPFLIVYLPRVVETGGWSWRIARHFSPYWFDVINVGPDNLLWGPLTQWLRARVLDPITTVELRTGITPGLFVIALIAIGAAIRQRRNAEPATEPFAWIAIAVLITWALTIRIGDFSPWWLVQAEVPGAGGARTVARYQIFLMAPITLLAIRWLDLWLAARAGWWAAALGLLVVVEQANGAPPLLLDRSAEVAALADVPPIPVACRSFYVVQARRQRYAIKTEIDSLYAHNVDAMIIAETRHVPTINGVSTINPADWDFNDSYAPDYVARARAYIRKHGLHDVCVLDRARGGWRMDVR